MKVVDFITYNEATDKEERGYGGLGGFFQKGMRWNDYKEQFYIFAHDDLQELRSAIISNEIRCTGSEHQNGYKSVPLWEDGQVDTYSFRAWGDLMAAVWSTEEDADYSYMDFYC